MLITQKPSFILLFLLISFGSVTAVLFTPALPQISAYFAVSDASAQLTITVFLIGYAVGQLIYGPLANGYGRKNALYFGIILEIVASLICALSANLHLFWLLVVARLFMALGASVGLKMTFTLVADCYTAAESTPIIPHLMIAFAITPGLGITLGGLLTDSLGWQSCFYFLALYGGVLLYLSYRLQETVIMCDRNALKLSNIIYKYNHILKNNQLVLGAVLMGCGTTVVYLFAALAPFITLKWMHLSASTYGFWNLLPPVGIIIGSQLSAYYATSLRTIYAIFLGIAIMLLGVIAMFIALLLQPLAIGLFLPLTIIYIGMSFIFANASSIAMSSVQDKSTASAMMSFINMGIATVSVLIVGLIAVQSSPLIPITYGVVILFALMIALILAKKHIE